jgi:hypothetical protein
MTTFNQPSDLSTTPQNRGTGPDGRTSTPQDRGTGTEGRTTRWGPAWVGAVVAVPVYVVLQLLFIAFGWMALGVDGAGAGVAASIVSAALAIIALLVGGLAGGTASSWGAASTSTALQGAMTWALTAVGLLTLGLFGGGALAGNLGGLTQLIIATGPQQFAGNPAVIAQAVQAVQNGAGWAALWLGVAFVAAVLGTGVGAGATKGLAAKGYAGEHDGRR